MLLVVPIGNLTSLGSPIPKNTAWKSNNIKENRHRIMWSNINFAMQIFKILSNSQKDGKRVSLTRGQRKFAENVNYLPLLYLKYQFSILFSCQSSDLAHANKSRLFWQAHRLFTTARNRAQYQAQKTANWILLSKVYIERYDRVRSNHAGSTSKQGKVRRG